MFGGNRRQVFKGEQMEDLSDFRADVIPSDSSQTLLRPRPAQIYLRDTIRPYC